MSARCARVGRLHGTGLRSREGVRPPRLRLFLGERARPPPGAQRVRRTAGASCGLPALAATRPCSDWPPAQLLHGHRGQRRRQAWDLRRLLQLTTQLAFPPPPPCSLLPRSYYMATAASDGVKLWDLRKLRNFKSLAPYESAPATAVAFDHSGLFLGVGGAGEAARALAAFAASLAAGPGAAGPGGCAGAGAQHRTAPCPSLPRRPPHPLVLSRPHLLPCRRARAHGVNQDCAPGSPCLCRS